MAYCFDMAKRRPSKQKSRNQVDRDHNGRGASTPHIGELNPNYIYFRSRQLEGTDPSDSQIGSWLITTQRIFYGWGNVSTKDWPCLPGTEPSTIEEPEGLDYRAKALRTQYYQRVLGVEEAKRAVQLKKPVMISLPATEQWFDAERGEIADIDSQNDILGSHCITLLGYSNHSKSFRFANSWGKDWGDKGFGYLSYRYYEDQSYESWLLTVGFDSRQAARDALENGGITQQSTDGVLELMWAVPDPLSASSAVHCREIYDYDQDERIGWAFATTRGGFLDVEDLFVRPAYRRRGYASRIAQMLLRLSTDVGLILRLQVSYADVGAENKEALDGILRVMGVTLRNTNQRGLAYVALPGMTSRSLEPIVIPKRPTLSRGVKGTPVLAPPSIIASHPPTMVGSAGHPDLKFGEDLYWHREAERITPSNEHLRAIIGRFTPAPGTFDDEEMPY